MPTRTIRPIPPLAVDATPSILTVAAGPGLLDEADGDGRVGWADGVQFMDLSAVPVAGRPLTHCDWEWTTEPTGAGTPGGADPNRPYATELPVADPGDWSQFYPWEFVAVAGCTIPTPSLDWEQIALDAVRGEVARQVSRELWTGYYSRGHALMRDAVELTAGTAVAYTDAFGLIFEQVADAGTWHVPGRLVGEIHHGFVVNPASNVPLGPGGWPLSFGPAYPTDAPLQPSPWRKNVYAPPHDPPGGAANAQTPLAAGQTYIVGHRGRVEVAWTIVDDPVPAAGRTGLTILHHGTNAVEAIARVRAIFRYNPRHVYAARVAV